MRGAERFSTSDPTFHNPVTAVTAGRRDGVEMSEGKKDTCPRKAVFLSPSKRLGKARVVGVQLGRD